MKHMKHTKLSGNIICLRHMKHMKRLVCLTHKRHMKHMKLNGNIVCQRHTRHKKHTKHMKIARRRRMAPTAPPTRRASGAKRRCA